MPRHFANPGPKRHRPDNRPPPIWPYIVFGTAIGLIVVLAWVLLDR